MPLRPAARPQRRGVRVRPESGADNAPLVEQWARRSDRRLGISTEAIAIWEPTPTEHAVMHGRGDEVPGRVHNPFRAAVSGHQKHLKRCAAGRRPKPGGAPGAAFPIRSHVSYQHEFRQVDTLLSGTAVITFSKITCNRRDGLTRNRPLAKRRCPVPDIASRSMMTTHVRGRQTRLSAELRALGIDRRGSWCVRGAGP